jgi:signal transduction histidine kinase
MGIRSLATASYVTEGRWKFLLSVQSCKARVWLEEDLQLLSGLAERIYMRLEHAAADDRLQSRTTELGVAFEALEREVTTRGRLEDEILEISEREQCRLGRDLHDGLSQELAGIALLTKAMANRLKEDAHPCADDAKMIAHYAGNSIDSARRIARGLYPIVLGTSGLLVALEDLANQTRDFFGVQCTLKHSGGVLHIAKSAEIHIYRMVQECVSNAIKHAQPRWISIELMTHGTQHTFTVTNDGRGFEKPAVSTGMGLRLLNYRARIIGALIEFRTPLEGGCMVSFCMPTPSADLLDTQLG